MTIRTHAILSTIRHLMRRNHDPVPPQPADALYFTFTRDGQWLRLSDDQIEAIKAAEAQSQQHV